MPPPSPRGDAAALGERVAAHIAEMHKAGLTDRRERSMLGFTVAEWAVIEAALRSADGGRDGGVEALADATVQLLQDMHLSGGTACRAAQAQARVAYESFREEPEDEVGIMPLAEARATMAEIAAECSGRSVLRDLSEDEKRARGAALADAYRREAEARGERPDSFFARWERVIKSPPLDPPPPDTDPAGRTGP